MGFFDKLKGNNQKEKETNSKLSNAESVMAIILAVIAIDGDLADDEIADFTRIINRSKLIQDLNSFEYDKGVDKVFYLLNNYGPKELAHLGIDNLEKEYCEALFINACDMLFSDGNIADEEKDFMVFLKNEMAISDEKTNDIIDFVIIKNSI